MDAISIADRRAELDQRQELIAKLLESAKCDQLLLFDSANVTWFCGQSIHHPIVDPVEEPCLIVTATQRWLVCASTDSQRVFNNYLDGLGFQLKEWPWQVGRDQLLA